MHILRNKETALGWHREGVGLCSISIHKLFINIYSNTLTPVVYFPTYKHRNNNKTCLISNRNRVNLKDNIKDREIIIFEKIIEI